MSIFTRLGVTDEASAAVIAMVISIGSGLVFLGFWRTASRAQCMILYAGYLLRCVCLAVDLYGRNFITLMHSGGDSEAFARNAAELYSSIEGYVSTMYPYAINGIYQITGVNRFCAQYINVIFWALSAGILIRICSMFHTKNNMRTFIYTVWSFLPTGILLSGILLRESAEVFFGMWSFQYFLIWMKDGRWKSVIQAFICVVPAIILHSASAALWATYVMGMMFWDVKKQKYRWQMKTMLIFFISTAGVFLLWKTPVGTLLFSKLGTEFSLYGITHRRYVVAGSDYLVDMDCQSWVQFVPYTLIRMFYFLFSPIPTQARGLQDIFSFCLDGLPLAVAICWAVCKAFKNREIQGYAYAALLGGFSFAGIFAWGVGNAGTALRHRYLAWSIFMISLCIACSYDGQKEMEAKKHGIQGIKNAWQ